MLLAMMAHNHV